MTDKQLVQEKHVHLININHWLYVARLHTKQPIKPFCRFDKYETKLLRTHFASECTSRLSRIFSVVFFYFFLGRIWEESHKIKQQQQQHKTNEVNLLKERVVILFGQHMTRNIVIHLKPRTSHMNTCTHTQKIPPKYVAIATRISSLQKLQKLQNRRWNKKRHSLIWFHPQI